MELEDYSKKIEALRERKNQNLQDIKTREKSKAITQMKLEFASRNKYIKDFLMEMIRDNPSEL